MRGTDEASGSLFSYVDLEERVPAKHPLRMIRQIVNDALAGLDAEFERSTRRRVVLDRAGAADPRQPAADPVLDPIRAAADGADGLQPAVPLVRGSGHRRSGLGPDGVHEEPRPAAHDRYVAQVDGGDPRAPGGEAAVVGRALLCGRHTGQSLGLDEELPAEGEYGATGRRGPRKPAADRHDPDHVRPAASNRDRADAEPIAQAAMSRSISRARNGRTRRTPRSRTRRRGSTRSRRVRARCCASWVIR